MEGLTAVISVKLKEAQFEGQTKGKLGSPEARGAVEQVFEGAGISPHEPDLLLPARPDLLFVLVRG